MGTLRDEKLGKFQSTHSQTPVVLLGFLLIIVINIPEVLGGKFSNAMGQISPHRHLNGIHGFPRKALKPDQHYEKGDQAKSSKKSYGGVADVILPVAKASPLNGGYWFQLHNESDVQSREVQIPRNTYKAVLEICVSFHCSDEFWYTNPPNEFLEANNVSDRVAGNGTFREVLVSVDGLLAGAVYPFPVFYTGGADYYFWRPISGIGSFVLPSYDVDITPFLGKLVDGLNHTFSATVTNALPFWLINANLHLWVNPSLHVTKGELVEHSTVASQSHTKSRFLGLDGTFLTDASRVLSYQGYLESSFGNLTTSAFYSSRFSNKLVYTEGARASAVHQDSKTEAKMVVKSDKKDLVYDRRATSFPLKFFYRETQHENGTVFVKVDVNRSWDQEQQMQSTIGEGGGSIVAASYFVTIVVFFTKSEERSVMHENVQPEVMPGGKDDLKFNVAESPRNRCDKVVQDSSTVEKNYTNNQNTYFGLSKLSV
nr:peptide-N4-(N-acetyl-beta-glucosaminyl)asparagine amidase A-like [Physcomitrium patens]|eukprot:XP_024402259.1 peptide-N4-(N-acetyl-beta-glucosaminyl)asparagine amidase A-like [Physcomitrella patens]